MDDLIRRSDAIRLAEQGQIQGFEWQFKKLCELPDVEPEYKELQDWKTDFKGFIDDLLYIPRDDYRGIMEYIDEVPSAEPERFKPCTVCQEFDCTGCKFRRT